MNLRPSLDSSKEERKTKACEERRPVSRRQHRAGSRAIMTRADRDPKVSCISVLLRTVHEHEFLNCFEDCHICSTAEIDWPALFTRADSPV